MLSFVPSIYYSAVIIPYFLFINPFSTKMASIISTSPYTPSYNSYAVSLKNLVWDFFLFSSLVCLILYCYCKEKFFLGLSWELKG